MATTTTTRRSDDALDQHPAPLRQDRPGRTPTVVLRPDYHDGWALRDTVRHSAGGSWRHALPTL